MSRKRDRKAAEKKDVRSPERRNLDEGLELLGKNELLYQVFHQIGYSEYLFLGKKEICRVFKAGTVYINKDILLTPRQWANVLVHGKLHFVFGHFDAEKMPAYEVQREDGKIERIVSCDRRVWNLACDAYISRFLERLKCGESIIEYPFLEKIRESADEVEIYHYLMESGAGQEFDFSMDMVGLEEPIVYDIENGEVNLYAEEFYCMVLGQASYAVCEAGGHKRRYQSQAQRAAAYFINRYPLLGALASAFEIHDDAELCIRKEIQVAAVDVGERIIYINSGAGLRTAELRFVLAHEYLHAGLQHWERRQGRDKYLWNVACDFVINGWLVEMGVGSMPEGCLYDETLQNWSAETIYDLLITNMKEYRKLKTFRGYGSGDIIGEGRKRNMQTGISADEFCRNALYQGLEYHKSFGRGMLPVGLEEEIRALAVPAIPWDVELGKWFERMLPVPQRCRSYARPSRRQSITPDIPRPRYAELAGKDSSPAFGVVIDTSGSMEKKLLGMALGAVAGYAVSRGVTYVRVIFCDARAYDGGIMTPEEIAGRVQIRGGGGTVLQQGVDLLEKATDFPQDAPILIITDAEIEHDLKVHRKHAFLIPQGQALPFKAKGEVFRFGESR